MNNSIKMTPIPGWVVYIPANIYTGKYYDYQSTNFFVEEQWGVTSPSHAVQWVMENKDKVLAKLDKSRSQYGNGTRRHVGHPIAKNVFFDQINSKIVKHMTIQRYTT